MYAGGLAPIIAGWRLKAVGVKLTYIYSGFMVVAILAILATPETRTMDPSAEW